MSDYKYVRGKLIKISRQEWIAQAKAQNKPRGEIAYICPSCGTVQCANDLVAAGAGFDLDAVACYAAFSCVGRWAADKGCDWTLGGLFRIHEVEVDGAPAMRLVNQPKVSQGLRNEARG